MISKLLLHKEKIFIFFLFFFSSIINYIYASKGVFPADSFFHFDTAYRILNGENPFMDFWVVSGPAIDYLQAIFFYFFGVTWNSYVMHSCLMNALLTLVTFFLLKNFNLKLDFCFIYSILFSILAYPSSGTPYVDHHSTFFSLISVYSFLMAMKSQKTIYWFLIPFFLFLGFLSKQVPAFYIFLSISFVLIFYSFTKRTLKFLSFYLISSLFCIFLFLIFIKLHNIKLTDFFTQYIFYPQSIGSERFDNFNFSFRGVFDHFKFIYLALLPILYINLKKIFSDTKYFKNDDFYYFLTLFFLTFSLIFHQIFTKNQTFIFFLIPLLTAFSHIAMKNFLAKPKKVVNILLITFCLFVTFKYHLRFNEGRKFHELNNANFNLSVNAENIDKNLSGLNWITPEKKDEPQREIDYLNEIISHLKKDSRKKMLLTNYSFLSSILDQNLFKPFRMYSGDGSSIPLKNSEYSEKYKKLMVNLIKKNKISVIYVIDPIKSNVIYDYINEKCFNEFSPMKNLKGYELKNCKDING